MRDLDEVILEDEFALRGISRRSGEVFQRLETAHASPAVVVVSTPKRREHQKTEVEPTVPGFREGRWAQYLDASRSRAEISSTARLQQRRRGRDRTQDVDKRAAKASMMVQFGELSSARQALEGADLAPGTPATFAALRDPARRLERPRDPIPER